MNYPLNMTLAGERTGFAVANDEGEHQALTLAGYVPPYQPDPGASDDQGYTVESARAALDAAGIAYDKRFGLAKLLTLLPQ